MPPTSTSTGAPAVSAACRVGQRSGSTAITRARSASAAAIPAISPPPPVATSTVSTGPTCSTSSSASVPLPAHTSGWSYACTSGSPVRVAYPSATANASA